MRYRNKVATVVASGLIAAGVLGYGVKSCTSPDEGYIQDPGIEAPEDPTEPMPEPKPEKPDPEYEPMPDPTPEDSEPEKPTIEEITSLGDYLDKIEQGYIEATIIGYDNGEKFSKDAEIRGKDISNIFYLAEGTGSVFYNPDDGTFSAKTDHPIKEAGQVRGNLSSGNYRIINPVRDGESGYLEMDLAERIRKIQDQHGNREEVSRRPRTDRKGNAEGKTFVPDGNNNIDLFADNYGWELSFDRMDRQRKQNILKNLHSEKDLYLLFPKKGSGSIALVPEGVRGDAYSDNRIAIGAGNEHSLDQRIKQETSEDERKSIEDSRSRDRSPKDDETSGPDTRDRGEFRDFGGGSGRSGDSGRTGPTDDDPAGHKDISDVDGRPVREHDGGGR